MNSRSYLTAVREKRGSVSGERRRVGANTIAKFSAFIMFCCCFCVTLWCGGCSKSVVVVGGGCSVRCLRGDY